MIYAVFGRRWRERGGRSEREPSSVIVRGASGAEDAKHIAKKSKGLGDIWRVLLLRDGEWEEIEDVEIKSG